MNEDEMTKEIAESVQAFTEPIDFGKLLEEGLLIKKGRSYYAPDIHKLPKNVSKRLKTVATTKDGIRVTFHKESKSLKKLADEISRYLD